MTQTTRIDPIHRGEPAGAIYRIDAERPPPRVAQARRGADG